MMSEIKKEGLLSYKTDPPGPGDGLGTCCGAPWCLTAAVRLGLELACRPGGLQREALAERLLVAQGGAGGGKGGGGVAECEGRVGGHRGSQRSGFTGFRRVPLDLWFGT